METDSVKKGGLFSYIATFALSFGCIIGWGSFILPGTRIIPMSGMVGDAIGLVLAALLAQLVCVNYIGMSKRHPDAKSSYDLVKGAFGADHAFFSAWALLLAYVCILWANMASIAYIGRLLFGRGILYRIHYTFMGFDVYPGDILFSAVILLMGAGLVSLGYKTALKVISAVVTVLAVSVLVMFFSVMSATDIHDVFTPAFSSTSGMSHGVQVIAIAIMAPWIFIGFEAVSHVAVEARISLKHIFVISSIAIIIAALFIYMIIMITNAGVPDGMRGWSDFAFVSGGITAFEDIPLYHAVHRTMGDSGTVFLALAFFGALFSSVAGFFLAALHTIEIMAGDGLAPKALLKKNRNGISYNAIHLILVFSIPFLFVGMNMLGWAIDISALAICIVYGYICLANFIKQDVQLSFRITGFVGALCAFGIFVVLLIPNSLLGSSLVKQDYMILMIWSLAGMVCYRYVLYLDKDQKLGKSMLMWILLFFLLFYSVNMWTNMQMEEDLLLTTDPAEISSILLTDNLVRTVVVVIAIVILFELFDIMIKREQKLFKEISSVKEESHMKNTMLNDLSHDIRTPMNAIVGFADLALQDKNDNDKMVKHMEKIRLSGMHLLALINDMFAINRLENGRMDLREEDINLSELLVHLRSVTSAGAYSRNHELLVEAHPLQNENIVSDRSNLIHMLSFFINDSINNTPDGGKIDFGVMQLSSSEDGYGMYEFYIKNNGGGYLPEGVGLTVTKKIIDVMGGHLEIEPEPGVGTEVFITMEFPISQVDVKKEDEDLRMDLFGKRVLIVDDIMVNRQIAIAMLEMYGIDTEEASDGDEAFNIIATSLPGHFDAVLMDIEMPISNGYEAARRIRGLEDPINCSVPILAMTANVFEDDRQKALGVGMNGFIAKPLNREYMIATISEQIMKRQGDTV